MSFMSRPSLTIMVTGSGTLSPSPEKLGSLEGLGIGAICFYPSPLQHDGYEIADYSDYGQLRDFEGFLKVAHAGLLRHTALRKEDLPLLELWAVYELNNPRTGSRSPCGPLRGCLRLGKSRHS